MQFFNSRILLIDAEFSRHAFILQYDHFFRILFIYFQTNCMICTCICITRIFFFKQIEVPLLPCQRPFFLISGLVCNNKGNCCRRERIFERKNNPLRPRCLQVRTFNINKIYLTASCFICRILFNRRSAVSRRTFVNRRTVSCRTFVNRRAVSCHIIVNRRAVSCYIIVNRRAVSCHIVVNRRAVSCHIVVNRRAVSCHIVVNRRTILLSGFCT